MGDEAKAMAYLARAKAIQPRAPAVRSLEVVLLSRAGKEDEALALAKQAVLDDAVDFDMANALFILAWRHKDYPLALSTMQLRMERFPETRVAGYLQLGKMYANDLQQPDKALAAFRQALLLVRPADRAILLKQVPPEFQAQLQAVASTPATASQTSANSK